MLKKAGLIISLFLFLPFTLPAAIRIPVPSGPAGIVVIILIVIFNITIMAARISGNSANRQVQMKQREVGRGVFYCPGCSDKKSYVQKELVGPGNRVYSEYIECTECKGTYKTEVLKMGEKLEKEQAEFLSIFQESMRKIMIKIMLADGKIDQAEKEKIIEIYTKLGRSDYQMIALDMDIGKIERENKPVIDYVREVSQKISDQAKAMLLYSAIEISASDGVIQKEERKMLNAIAKELAIPQSMLELFIARAKEKTPFTEEDFPDEE